MSGNIFTYGDAAFGEEEGISSVNISVPAENALTITNYPADIYPKYIEVSAENTLTVTDYDVFVVAPIPVLSNNDFTIRDWRTSVTPGFPDTGYQNATIAALDNMVIYMPFHETSGTQVTDYLGTGAENYTTNILNDINDSSIVDGFFTKARDFGAQSTAVELIEQNGSLSNIPNWTLSFWFKWNAASIPVDTFTLVRFNVTNGLYIYINTSHHIQAYFTGSTEAEGVTTLTGQTWYNIVATFDGSTVRTYTNGELDGSSADTGVLEPYYRLEIGVDADTDFTICDLGLWKRVLDVGEVENIWNNGTGTPLFVNGTILTSAPETFNIADFNQTVQAADKFVYAEVDALTITDYDVKLESNFPAKGYPGLINAAVAGLISYLPFDETSGSNVDDIMGSGDESLDCTVSNDPGDFTIFPGIVGNSRNFELGTGTAQIIKTTTSTTQLSTWSISYWFRCHDITQDEFFVNISNTADIRLGVVATFPGTGLARAYLSGTNLYSTTSVTDGQWHHLVLTQKGSFLSLYLDGTLADTSATARNLQPFVKFYVRYYTTAQHNPAIDEFAIWDFALNSVDVGNVYNAGSGLHLIAPGLHITVPNVPNIAFSDQIVDIYPKTVPSTEDTLGITDYRTTLTEETTPKFPILGYVDVAAGIADNLLHYWTFDDASSPIIDLIDAGPVTMNLALIGTVNQVTGKLGDARRLLAGASNESYYSVSNANATTIDVNWAMSLWAAYGAGTTAGGNLVQDGGSFTIFNELSTLQVKYGAVTISSDTSWSSVTGAWHHIVVVGSSSGVEFFLDGVSQGSNATTYNLEIYDLLRSNPGTFFAAPGVDIDEFAIWDRHFYEHDIENLYNSGAGRLVIRPTEYNIVVPAENTFSITDIDAQVDSLVPKWVTVPVEDVLTITDYIATIYPAIILTDAEDVLTITDYDTVARDTVTGIVVPAADTLIITDYEALVIAAIPVIEDTLTITDYDAAITSVVRPVVEIAVEVYDVVSPSVTIEVDVTNTVVTPSVGIAVEVYETFNLSQQVEIQVIDLTDRSYLWGAQVLLNGTDISDRITGAIEITHDEDSSGTAVFAILPSPGVIDTLSYISKTVIIKYVEYNSSGSATIAATRFTGIVITPAFDPDTGLLSFTCGTNIQGRVNSTNRDVLKTMVPGSSWSKYIFDEEADNWQYFQDLLSTTTKFTWVDMSGVLRVADWQAAGAAHHEYGNADYVAETVDVRLATRNNLTNDFKVSVDYRYSRHMQRNVVYSFLNSIPVCEYVSGRGAFPLPSRDQIKQATESGNWTRLGGIRYEPVWPAGFIFCDGDPIGWLGDASNSYCLGAMFTMFIRWTRTLTESYIFTLKAPKSQEANGKISAEEEYGIDAMEDFEDSFWEQDVSVIYGFPDQSGDTTTFGLSFAMPANSVEQANGDWMYPAVELPGKTRENMEEAQTVALNKAKSELLKGHRQNEVSFTVPLDPSVTLEHTARINTSRIVATGKIRSISESMDVSTGEATTTITLAISRAGATGVETETPIVPEEADTDVLPLTEYDKYVHLPIRLGGRIRNTLPYDENWDGYTSNYQYDPDWDGQIPASGIPPVVEYYPDQFTINYPDIEEGDRAAVTVETETEVIVNIPNDEFTEIV